MCLFASVENVQYSAVRLLCRKVGVGRGREGTKIRVLETLKGVIPVPPPVLACLKESPGSAAGDLIVFYFCDRKRFLEEDYTRRKGRAVELALGHAQRIWILKDHIIFSGDRLIFRSGSWQMFGTNGTGMCLASLLLTRLGLAIVYGTREHGRVT